MSDYDERGRRIPDYDERRDAADERRRLQNIYHCLCGNPDIPGSCPGPAACPMHGETLEES